MKNVRGSEYFPYPLYILLLCFIFICYFFALSIERTCPDLHFTTDYILYNLFFWNGWSHQCGIRFFFSHTIEKLGRTLEPCSKGTNEQHASDSLLHYSTCSFTYQQQNRTMANDFQIISTTDKHLILSNMW